MWYATARMSKVYEESPGVERDHQHWDEVEEAVELLHEERFREALVTLHEVLQRNTRNPYAFYFLGVALYEVGELEPARDAYCASLKFSPEYLGARIALSHVLRKLGDLRGALREGMEALSQVPGDSEALHAVGLAYLARGDRAAAHKYLEAFLETGPELEVDLEIRGILAQITGGDPHPREAEEPS